MMLRTMMLWGALVSLVSLGAVEAAEPLRVMTFNIRYDNKGDGENAWPNRKDWVAEIIKREKPDLLGVQEALHRQVKDLEERLPEYAWYGVGRDDGKEKGEYVPAFYRKDRFELLDKGEFWLSETPEKPGSKGWDTSITRLVVWVKLKDKKGGQTLLYANTHFDHMGKQARVESAKLVNAQLPKLAGDLPVILTGDFNTRPKSEPYQILTGQDSASTWVLSDSRVASKTPPTGPDASINGFRKIMPQQLIDFIFIRGLTSQSHAILTDEKEGKFPSDHLPVVAELVLP